MSRGLIAGLVLATALAWALRAPRLNERPMHNDEAVNAVKFGRLWEEGSYKYDPNEHHGPTLYYATLAFGRLLGVPDFAHFTETTYRSLTLCFGLGLLLLLPLVADGLGRNATLWAALFTAVSPAFVFYSRYYIHEILLVFFSFLALAAGWRYWRSRRPGWLLLAGLGVGLMDATKETFVISLVVAALALGLNQAWNRWLDASSPPVDRPPLKAWHWALAGGVWLAVAVVFFSSFFSNPSGPLDSVRTYLPWLHRAEGASPHVHPWTFYLHRLLFFHEAKGPAWSEALILALALIATAAAFARRGLGDSQGSFTRFLALYAFGLMAGYCVIAYKTPWCLLTFWHPMLLLAGLGAAVVLRAARPGLFRGALTLVLLGGAAQLSVQAWQAAIPYAADPRNPYVYAQTSPDVLRLVTQVKALAAVHPDGGQMVVQVMAPDNDYWPLPWYFRSLTRVGWWAEVPAAPYAPVMVVSSQFQANLDQSKTHVMVGYFQLRPQCFFELYVELNLWRAYLVRNPPKPAD